MDEKQESDKPRCQPSTAQTEPASAECEKSIPAMESNTALNSQESTSQEPSIYDKPEPLDSEEFSSFFDSESKDNLEMQAFITEDTTCTEQRSDPKLEFKLPYGEQEHQHQATREGGYEIECRICQSTGEERLISPCKCSGSAKWVHESCLVLWFQVSRASKCELCSEKITVKKYTKPVREWKRPNGRSIGPCSKVDLWYVFVMLFSLGTIIGFAVFQTCVGSEDTETTVVFTAIYVLCAFMIVLRVHYFYRWFTRRSFFWQKWRRLNQQWFISLEGRAREVQKVTQDDPGYELQEVLCFGPVQGDGPLLKPVNEPGLVQSNQEVSTAERPQEDREDETLV